MIRAILTVAVWLILLSIPLISVGGFMAAHGLLNRVLIAVVLYVVGIVCGAFTGFLLAEIGGNENVGRIFFGA